MSWEADHDNELYRKEDTFNNWLTGQDWSMAFISLEQTRKELGSENGRIAMCARIADLLEEWMGE